MASETRTVAAGQRSRAVVPPGYVVSERPARSSRSLTRLGFWSASLTAVFSLGWLISVVVQQAVAPVPPWQGAQVYAGEFSPLHQLPLYPSLLLALAFLVLLSCIHLYVPADRKAWSLSALVIGVLYAAMASVSYNIQVVSVRRTLLAGETDGLTMFPLANPEGIARALGNSYVYMALAMVFAAFAFGSGRLERWVKRLLIAAGLAAPLQFGWSLFDVRYLLEASIVPWVLGAVIAPVLMAVLFRRAGRVSRDTAVPASGG